MATYTTEQGESWDSIAYKLYGDEKYMTQLILANWGLLDVEVFSAGTVLTLPEISEETEETENVPIWRSSDDTDEGIPAADDDDGS